jgi:hypothetical protein
LLRSGGRAIFHQSVVAPLGLALPHLFAQGGEPLERFRRFGGRIFPPGGLEGSDEPGERHFARWIVAQREAALFDGAAEFSGLKVHAAQHAAREREIRLQTDGCARLFELRITRRGVPFCHQFRQHVVEKFVPWPVFQLRAYGDQGLIGVIPPDLRKPAYHAAHGLLRAELLRFVEAGIGLIQSTPRVR